MENIREIAGMLSETNDPALIEDFFLGILTKTELENIDSRWEILKLLDRGVSQRQIASDLHLSLCKITRGARVLHKENPALKKLVHKINN